MISERYLEIVGHAGEVYRVICRHCERGGSTREKVTHERWCPWFDGCMPCGCPCTECSCSLHECGDCGCRFVECEECGCTCDGCVCFEIKCSQCDCDNSKELEEWEDESAS